jgi:hypothetical protein
VIETADFGLFELEPAEFVGLLVGNAADAVDDLAAVFETSLRELIETLGRGGDRLIDRLEDPSGAVARLARGGNAGRASQLGEHFLNNLTNRRFSRLHMNVSL